MRMKRFALIQVIPLVAISVVQLSVLGCTPTIAIKAPKKPIVINLNIKVEHEIILIRTSGEGYGNGSGKLAHRSPKVHHSARRCK